LAATLAQLETAGPVLAPPPEVAPVDLPPVMTDVASAPVEPPQVFEAAPAPEAAPTEGESEVVSGDGESDAFIAELRRAVVDDRPLGPREDDVEVDVGDPFEEFIRYAADADEPRGLSSRLRRRR
jgi:hypothetical protein